MGDLIQVRFEHYSEAKAPLGDVLSSKLSYLLGTGLDLTDKHRSIYNNSLDQTKTWPFTSHLAIQWSVNLGNLIAWEEKEGRKEGRTTGIRNEPKQIF